MTDVSTTRAVVIFSVKCVLSRELMVLKLWLLTWLVNQVAMLLVVWQLSRDIVGYEDSKYIFYDNAHIVHGTIF